MSVYVVGSVPYVNAKPLVFALDEAVRVEYRVPSLLPALLDSGEADAVLASSFEAFQTPDRAVVEGVCIGSTGAVHSVRLFSKVPFEQIKVLALDRSSLTSNHLARLLLKANFGLDPESHELAPDLRAMLAVADAAVLIGDAGMDAPSEDLVVMDLGDAWTTMTGLPFVWAMWIGRGNLAPDLARLLNEAMRKGLSEQMLLDASRQSGWPVEKCRSYLFDTIEFECTARHMQGLAEFRRLLQEHSIADCPFFPKVVGTGQFAVGG